MDSRTKVRNMLNRKPYDGMVIDFGGNSSTGIHAAAYVKLVEALGLPKRLPVVYDVFQQQAKPDLDVVEKFGGDFLQVTRMRPRFNISCKEWKEYDLPGGGKGLYPYEFNPVEDEAGNRNIIVDGKAYARMPKGGWYYDIITRPLEGVEDERELERFTPAVMLDDEVEYIATQADEMYKNTDKALVLGFGGSLFEQGQRDFGYETFYCNLLAAPELIHAYFNKLTEAYMYNLKKLLPKIAGKVDVIQFFDDLGTQTGPQISIETYKDLIKPYHARLYGAVHQMCPEMKVLLHSCGAIFDFIPEFVEAGVDMLNPVQISAKGMEPDKLKKAYGDKMIFWGGGADLQLAIPEMDVKAIQAYVVDLARIFNENGGYVFSQIHNVQPGLAPEKVIAIFEAAGKLKG